MKTLTCPRCGTSAPASFVACPKCLALFHADALTALSREADALEHSGDLVGALGKLRAMEPLLPHHSTQATTLRARIAALEPKAGVAASRGNKGGGLLAGSTAALVALLTKGKFLLAGLLKLPTLLTFFISASLWRDGSSGLGLGLVVLGSIYVHEMGHTFAFRRYGIAVTAPMFVPGFGAFVRGAHYPRSLSAIGDVALSGPLWGGATGIAVLGLGLALHQPWLTGAAVLIAEINLFNLIPVWQLDGNRALACLAPQRALTVGVAGLFASLIAASPLGAVASAGLIARRWVRPPPAPGDRRTFILFVSVMLGLLALRFAAQFFTTSLHGSGD